MDSNTFNHYTTIGKVVFKLHNVDLMGWFLAECMSYVGLNVLWYKPYNRN